MPTVEPRKLNKKLPYGEIYGEVANNAKYEQDGKHFDAEGRELRPLAEVEEALALDTRTQEAAEEKRIQNEVDKRLKALLTEKEK